MADPGFPTSKSHDRDMPDLVKEFNGKLIEAYNVCNLNRIAMAAGPVGDDTVKELWNRLAQIETRLKEIRRTSNFQDEYARSRGLVKRFNCNTLGSGGDVNAATDKITGLPVNHGFLTDHPVDFSIIEGSLPGGLSEGTTYWIRTVELSGANDGTVTLSATEGGASDVNLTGNVGRAWMRYKAQVNMPTLMTNIDAALDEIEANLPVRASTYGDRTTQAHTYLTRDSTATSALRTDLQNIEDLIDVTP